MGSLNSLQIPTDPIDLPDDIPEQIGAWSPPPQPGPYIFRLPGNLTNVWEMADVRNDDAKKALNSAKGLMANFSNEFPLTIIQSKYYDDNVNDIYKNDDFTTRITLIPRKRDKAGTMVSDMYYFLKALGHDMSSAKTWSQMDWAQAVMTHAGQEFAADIEWTARCGEDRIRRIWADETCTTTEEDPDSTMGCGQACYQQDIPKDENGYYMQQFNCPKCKDAVLRCFANLTRFKAEKKEG